MISRWAVVAAYMYLVYNISSRPISLPQVEVVPLIGIDKLLHFVEYGVMAFFVCRAMSVTTGSPLSKTTLFAAIVICAVYAALDEIHQSFVPARNCSVADFIADGVGAMAVVLLWPRLTARFPILRS